MRDNHVCDGLNAGLFLHRSSDHAIVTGNHVHNNGDAGLAVLEAFYMEVSNNVFTNNRYGIRFSVGSGYNWVSVRSHFGPINRVGHGVPNGELDAVLAGSYVKASRQLLCSLCIALCCHYCSSSLRCDCDTVVCVT